jgi:hypothetical protein
MGFIDNTVRKIELESNKKRIVFVGDSFTEGLGVTYDESFVGLISTHVDSSKIQVFNAGVVSYSPKLYYLKIKYALEKASFRFNYLFIFIDIRDLYDELSYEEFHPTECTAGPEIWYQLKKKLKSTSYTYYSIEKMYGVNEYEMLSGSFPQEAFLEKEFKNDPLYFQEGIWTLHEATFNRFAARGLKLASENIEKLIKLCRDYNITCTIVVYPWPVQIKFRDVESIQVQFWRRFSKVNNVGFVDLFPDFINERKSSESIYDEYFISGDVHWNREGHKLVYRKIIRFIPF